MAQASHAVADSATGAGWKVLEFGLGEDTYCLRIDTIDEIVDAGELTPIPNAPYHVDGVMDLRGRTTTIVDPKKVFDIEGGGARERILVFEEGTVDEDGTVGWMVDDVYQVRDVSASDIEETSLAEESGVRGVVRGQDDDLVVWLEPDLDEDEQGV